ncbi:hypothetical protein MYXO_02306 [Myxococcaceae bacterium]|jgi:uncharacterized membrane protein YkvA (DUF1232 family)|nr:hypothetical protein MYXO_02306 [Myxococcaceae bacterium]
MTQDPITIELNPREVRLYDRIRSRIVAPRPGESSGVGDLLLLLPDLTVLLLRLLRDDRIGIGAKGLALLGVGYIFSPIDLLPEVLLGPIGLLDDLLVVAATLSRLVNHVHPDVVRSHWSGQGDALEAIQRVLSFAEAQVGGMIERLWRTLGFARRP